jgi:hypothetical protein
LVFKGGGGALLFVGFQHVQRVYHLQKALFLPYFFLNWGVRPPEIPCPLDPPMHLNRPKKNPFFMDLLNIFIQNFDAIHEFMIFIFFLGNEPLSASTG